MDIYCIKDLEKKQQVKKYAYSLLDGILAGLVVGLSVMLLFRAFTGI